MYVVAAINVIYINSLSNDVLSQNDDMISVFDSTHDCTQWFAARSSLLSDVWYKWLLVEI